MATRDVTQGIPIRELDGEAIVQGQVGDQDVIVVKRGSDIFAIGARCSHYHGPLAEGLLVGDTVRCPWHHACFSLRTGEAVRAPALDAVGHWRTERQGDVVFVREKLPDAGPRAISSQEASHWPDSVVIVGGGGAGLAAADMLRREGYARSITMLSAGGRPVHPGNSPVTWRHISPRQNWWSKACGRDDFSQPDKSRG